VTTDGPTEHDLRGFDAATRQALSSAVAEARSLGHDRVGTEHLLLGLLVQDGTAAVALRRAGAQLAPARRKVAEAVGSSSDAGGDADPGWTARAGRAVGRAPRFARDQGDGQVGCTHLLLAVLDVEGTAGQVLRGLDVDLEQLAAGLRDVAPDPARPAHDVDDATRPALGPACPVCHTVVDRLVGSDVRVVREGQGAVGGAVAVSCPSCGSILGVVGS
jgi:ATP-dependent Clp protease ATP-binding subunit ClpA